MVRVEVIGLLRLRRCTCGQGYNATINLWLLCTCCGF